LHPVIRANAMLARQANVIKLTSEEERRRALAVVQTHVPFTVSRGTESVSTNIYWPQIGVTLHGVSILEGVQTATLYFQWTTAKRIDVEYLFFVHIVNSEV
jgi:hypothetical protein